MATILDLLAALNRGDLPPLPDPAKPVGDWRRLLPPTAPLPTAPVGNLGPLSTDTTAAFGALNPEPVPPAITPPTLPDSNFIDQYAGLRPTAPAPLSRGQRIANALAGFGAGFQGNGAQFLQQLQEPQREYQRQLERYDARRAQGLEIAERRARDNADRANRAAEAQYEREYRQWEKKSGIRHDEAKALMRQAFDLNNIRERERIADEKQQKAIEAATEKQRRDIEDELATKDGAPASIAREISEYRVGKRPSLSAAAEKWRGLRARKLEKQLARVGGSGGSAGPVMAQLQNGQVVPLSAVDKQSGGVMLNGDLVPVVGYVGGKIPAKSQQQGPTLQLPEYDPTRIFQQLTPPTAQTFTRAQVKEFARRNRRKPAEVEADLKARGFTVE